jgi:DNA repair photolyase
MPEKTKVGTAKINTGKTLGTGKRDEVVKAVRGSYLGLGNRFEKTKTEAFDDGWDREPEEIDLPIVQTEFFTDHTRSILAKNDSPDISFTYSVNAYRGCEHGCAYCYARPTHEYLGFDPALDFESKIMVKHDAPALLRKAFDANSYKPQVIVMSGNTDCYQPAEKKYELTRRMLEVFLEYRNPVAIITKNALVMRDKDILAELAKKDLVIVCHSITTLDRKLARVLEPRTSTPERRLLSIKTLSALGVPTAVMIGPVIPGLNDDEILPILKAASEAGAKSAGYNMVRLPLGVAPIFKDWLERHMPLQANRILTRIEMVRDGKMNDSNFSSRMRGEGGYADYVQNAFRVARRKYGLTNRDKDLRTDLFRRPNEMTLFDED